MPEPIDPASVPTLQNTLPPGLDASIQQAAAGLPADAVKQALGVYGAFSPTLAEQQALRAGMTAPGGATTLEQQAQAAYQQAAAAPAPQVSGARQGLNELLGSVASILSGNQVYRENAATRLQREQQALMDSRKENLSNLKDIYEQRASAAKSIGNTIAEEENRLKKDRIDKTLEALQKSRDAMEEMRQIGAKQRADKTERQAQQLVNQAQIRWQKESGTMQDILDYRNQIMQTSNDSVGDLFMLRYLARISDPRTGVREQEFETFKRAEGELKRVFNAPRSWFGQGMLSDEGRRAVRAEAEKIFRQRLATFDNKLRNKRSMYIHLGMDPADAEVAIDDVLGPYRSGLEATAKSLGLSGTVYTGSMNGQSGAAQSDTTATHAKPTGMTPEKLAELKKGRVKK